MPSTRRQSRTNQRSDETVSEHSQSTVQVNNTPAPIKKRAPKYSGAPDEDPNAFLTQAEEYLRTEVHPDDWTQVIQENLTGEAESWNKKQRYKCTWEQFKELLLENFDSIGVKASLKIMLYSKRQTQQES